MEKYCCEVEPENVPDLVAVVRCKDCLYFNDHAITVHGADMGECEFGVERFVPPDWYCADGERK